MDQRGPLPRGRLKPRGQAGIRLVRGHRALLVLATAILAIAASRVAADAGLVGAWVSLASSAMVLYIADAVSDVDRTALALAQSSGKNVNETRLDVLEARGPRHAAFLTLGGVVLMIGGLAFDAILR
jgi:hypothetical protein